MVLEGNKVIFEFKDKWVAPEVHRGINLIGAEFSITGEEVLVRACLLLSEYLFKKSLEDTNDPDTPIH